MIVMSDQDIGYLKRAVEDMQALLKAHIEDTKEERTDLDKRLAKIEDHISVGRTLYKSAKFLWFAGILIITLKMGDIPKLWGSMFQ